MSLATQTDAQLEVALEICPTFLRSDERQQIRDERHRRVCDQFHRAFDRNRTAATDWKDWEERQKEKHDLVAMGPQYRTLSDDELAARLNAPQHIVDLLFARKENSRREKSTKRRAVKATLPGFRGLSHDELLAWQSSHDEIENQAAIKECKARIKALEAKIFEITVSIKPKPPRPVNIKPRPALMHKEEA